MTVRRPSSTKVERAKWIALRINQAVPDGALGDDKELSAWIKVSLQQENGSGVFYWYALYRHVCMRRAEQGCGCHNGQNGLTQEHRYSPRENTRCMLSHQL